MEENNKILIYTDSEGLTKIDVILEDETLWLTQAQMCELYQTSCNFDFNSSSNLIFSSSSNILNFIPFIKIRGDILSPLKSSPYSSLFKCFSNKSIFDDIPL